MNRRDRSHCRLLALETEIELICELRASQGEVWFDEASLRLVRR
jgi:hypothetical protein